MILFFHVLSYIIAVLGVGLAYLLRDKIPRNLKLFVFFTGIGLLVHLFFDYTVNPREEVINILINLEPWDYGTDVVSRFSVMFNNELLRFSQWL